MGCWPLLNALSNYKKIVSVDETLAKLFCAKDKQVVSFQMHTWCPFGRSSATSHSPTIAPTMVRQALRHEETEMCDHFDKIMFCFSKLKMNPYVRSNVASRHFLFQIAQQTIVGTTFGLAWSVTPSVLDSYLVVTKDFSWDSTCRPEISAMVVPTWFPLRVWWEKNRLDIMKDW